MKYPIMTGTNRTGIDVSPQHFRALIQGVQTVPPTSSGNERTLLEFRTPYLEEAEPIGSVPVPATSKGAVKAGLKKLTGRHAEVLIDALGARLAFERTGTRLYDALLGKCMVRRDEAESLPFEQIEQFRAEEASHISMVWDALRQMGADPTSVTPMADTDAVASIGLMQIITDPRMSVAQSFHAIHIAELADNDGWQLLIKLAEQLGQHDMAEQFQQALAEEDQHLTLVRKLVEQMSLGEAGA